MSRRTSRTPAPGILELSRRPLEAQVELLLLELHQLVGELVELSPFTGFINLSPTPAMRCTKRVLIGSLAAASMASLASCTDTPSSSNRMRPGLTRSPSTRCRPCRNPCAPRAASWSPARPGTRGSRRGRRASRGASMRARRLDLARGRAPARAPSGRYSPKARRPEVARPLMRPLCALRNLVRMGCSICFSHALFAIKRRRGAGGRPRPRPSSCPVPSGRARGSALEDPP